MAWAAGSELNHRYPAWARAAGAMRADHPDPGQAAVGEGVQPDAAHRPPARPPGARAGCRAAAGCARAAAASRRSPPAGAGSSRAGLHRDRGRGVVLEVRGVDDQLPDLPGEGRAGRRRSHARRRAAAASPSPRPWSGPGRAGSAGRPRCRSRRCWRRPRRRTRWLARSMVSPSSSRGSGITWPRTRSLATPPSGKIDSRTWVNRCVVGHREHVVRVAPQRRCAARSRSSPPRGRRARPGSGSPRPRTPRPGRTRGKLPVKKLVSTSTAVMTPGAPSRISAQSWPGSRRRLVSQPSTISPRAVVPGLERGRRRASAGAPSRRTTRRWPRARCRRASATRGRPAGRRLIRPSPAAGAQAERGGQRPGDDLFGLGRRRRSRPCWSSGPARRSPRPAARRPRRRRSPARRSSVVIASSRPAMPAQPRQITSA